MKRIAFALALALSGCADNAILELELAMPAASAACGASRAAIEARIPSEGSCFFDQEWLDGDRVVVPLEATERARVVSVVARGEDVPRPLCVRVRACRGDECPPAEVTIGPRAEIEIERAFYLGRYTRLGIEPIDLCADSSTLVEPCDVTCADPAPACDPDAAHPCE